MELCIFPKFNHVLLFLLISFDEFLLIFSYYGKLFDIVFCTKIYFIGAGINTLISFFDGLGLYFFCQMMKKTRSKREEMIGKVFISCQIRRFSFRVNKIKALFPICTLIWLVNNYVSRQGKSINRRNASTSIIINFIFEALCPYYN